MTPNGEKIIKLFERLGNVGRRNHEVFEDFVAATGAVLTALNPLAQAADHTNGTEDSGAIFSFEPVPQVVARIRSRYDEYYQDDILKTFEQAIDLLIEDANDNISFGRYFDTIGDVYMLYAYPNEHQGQYFTSYEVADLLARLTDEPDPDRSTFGNLEKVFMDRLTAAVERARDEGNDAYIKLQARVLAAAASGIPTPEQRLQLINLLYQCGFEPVSLYDPTCGSGVLLLAQAARFLRWALTYGLVRVYGQDLDPTCVAMARINCMLYGLNGYGLRCVLEMSDQEITQLEPSPAYVAAIETAKTAAANGDQEMVRQIANEARASSRASQMSLFDLLPAADG